MADDQQSTAEASKDALQEEKIQQDIHHRKLDREKKNTGSRQPDDWSLL